MSPITERDFQSELPLNPAAAELLATFFEQGWPDPTKLHNQSARLRNLLATAQESIAASLGVQREELEFVGELGFGFQTAVSGLLRNSNQDFTYAEIDRQIIHAFARQQEIRGAKLRCLNPESNGTVDYSEGIAGSVLCWQATNRETGVQQGEPNSSKYQSIFADMTASFQLNRLPEKWDAALWDPRSFGGPQGIAIVGISNQGSWTNPGPQIDKRRVFGSYSKPLLLATAVALESWQKTAVANLEKIRELNQFARNQLIANLPDVRIAGDFENCDPRYLAFALKGVIAEEVLRKMESGGFLIDAGSACGGGALSPSHVLSAMGFPIYGNLRLTFKAEQSKEAVAELIKGIAASA